MRMETVEFDLIKLKQLCGIDVRGAVKNFNSYEDYFQGLLRFIKDSKYYLREYTGDMVVSQQKECVNFLNDLRRIRSDLLTIGISSPLTIINELDYEAQCGNSEALTAWIQKFQSEITCCAEKLTQSQIISEKSQDDRSQRSGQEKPLILAADDKPELLTAVVNMLEDRFRVMAATSGKAALRLIEKHPPVLFLLDIEMPQMDGYELAETIRKQERFEHTPIIFLTSRSTRDDVVIAIRRGGNDYLVKPVNKDLLLSKILQHLGSM